MAPAAQLQVQVQVQVVSRSAPAAERPMRR
jgi:hypothetical protein